MSAKFSELQTCSDDVFDQAPLLLPRAHLRQTARCDAKPVGSALIGQNFVGEKYFRGRPSATQAHDPRDATKTIDAPYNAANSGGANLGPTSQRLVDRLKAGVEAKHAAGRSRPVPADAITTSASGLDPHISPADASAQIVGLAKARGLEGERLTALVGAHTQGRLFGVIGEPRVNVLNLNLALDGLTGEKESQK